MANNKIPSRGAKLLAVSGPENNFFVYSDLSKTSTRRGSKDFDRVVSSGTISTDNTGSPWLKVFGYKFDKKDSTGYVLVDDGGTVWQDQPVDSKPVPNIPESVMINSTSGGKGVLSWRPIDDAAVEIEFASTVQGPFRLIAISTVGGSSYDINNLTKGIIFYYRLRSTNDFGESEYTNVVSATDVDPTAPVTTEPVGTTVTSPATPDAPPVVIPPSSEVILDIYKSPINDNENSSRSMEEPIITWIKKNTVLTLAIGAGIIVALMMIVIASRRS